MTRPSSGASAGQWSSTARAMAPAALPAPTTSVRPAGGGGRWRGTIASGSAAPTAAEKLPRRSSRGFTERRCRELGSRPAPGRPPSGTSTGGRLPTRGRLQNGLEEPRGEALGRLQDLLRRALGDDAPAA